MIESQLRRLETSDLVRRLADPSTSSGDLAYLFKHALVQDTAYESLLKQDRKRLHRAVAECLERVYAARLDQIAARLVQHFAEAGDEQKTLMYARRAGDAAMRVHAHAEGQAHYARAIELAQRTDAAQLQELFLKLGRAFEVGGRYERALETYQEMERVAGEHNDRALLLAAWLAQATVFAVPTPLYDDVRAQQLSNDALELARELNDAAAESKILWNQMLRLSRVGMKYQGAMAMGERALDIARAHNLREQIAYLLNDLSHMYIASGEMERGHAYNRESRAMWREFDNLPMLVDNMGYAVMNHLLNGNLPQAVMESETALQLSREIGNAWNEAFSQTWIGEAYFEMGEVTRAIEVMNEAIRLGNVFPPTLVLSVSDLAKVYGDLGFVERGLELGLRAEQKAREMFPALRPWAMGALAHLYLLQGDYTRAQEILAAQPGKDADTYARFGQDSSAAEIEMALAQNDLPRALQQSEAFLERVRVMHFGQYLPNALRLRADALFRAGEVERAAELLQEGRAVTEQMHARWSQWQIFALWSEVEKARGDFEKADALRDEAHAVVEYIAARVPEEIRRGFLELARVRVGKE